MCCGVGGFKLLNFWKPWWLMIFYAAVVDKAMVHIGVQSIIFIKVV